MRSILWIIVLAGIILVITRLVFMLTTKPASPEAIVRYNSDGPLPNIQINYSRPAKKGRDVFGWLVPYGEVWRTGANAATEISIDKNVVFGGKKIKKGTYTLFTIPEKDNWTIILNSATEQWGHFSYDDQKDILRTTVPTQTLNKDIEIFTISIKVKSDSLLYIKLKWDKTQVSVPVTLGPEIQNSY